MEHICLSKDMGCVVNMFLPIHMNMYHRLSSLMMVTTALFWKVSSPMPKKYLTSSTKPLILTNTNHQIEMPSSDSLFPCIGIIDLVVVVFLASVVRDICNNRNTAFSWNYNDSPSLRAKLMLQILDILH